MVRPDVALATPVLRFAELDSTNAEARRRAEAGEAGPLWIAAARQTAGRGRRGRAWDTGAGNLAATLLMTTDASPQRASEIAFVAALAVHELATSVVPESLVRVKWPNDVLVDGRKASGMLLESGRRDDGRLWLAIGIGVNLASAPADVERPATCLKDHLAADIRDAPPPEAALTSLDAALGRWLQTWERAGFGPIREAWSARAYGLGQPCTARLDQETVDGVAEGLEEDGALKLRLSDGRLRRITAGDVFFPPQVSERG